MFGQVFLGGLGYHGQRTTHFQENSGCRQSNINTMFLNSCFVWLWYPRPQKHTWPTNHFGIPSSYNVLGFGKPRRPQTPFQKVGGRSPAPSGMVLGATGAAQTPKIGEFRPAQKPCIKNISLSCFSCYKGIGRPNPQSCFMIL